MKKLRQNKGITLIALIITIIVMLILVGVTINVALNGGLFQKADDATKLTQEAADKEELQLEIVTAYNEKEGTVDLNLLKTNLEKRNWKDVTISGDKLTCTSPKGNTFTVTADGKISEGGNDAGSGNQTGSLTDFEKYILGSTGTGRTLVELDEEGNPIGGITNFAEFLDDPLTEDVDETKTLGVELLTTGQNEDQTKGYIYAKYDNKVYRVIVDAATYSSELPLDVVYEPQGREGQPTADGWTILYDNGTTVEAVSPEAMGSLRLGYSETATSETRLTEAIDSYNSAITTINNYCKNELTGLPTNSNVRSVGASSETSDAASNKYTLPEEWNSTYDGVGKKGDTLFEQDFVRMAYHGVLSTGTNYWMASRVVLERSDLVSFYVYYVYEDGILSNNDLWHVESSGSAYGGNYSCAVRPIITIQNP